MSTKRRQRRVTAEHRADMIRMLSFGAMTFRAICTRYAAETTGGKVDRGLVRGTLDSCIARGDVVTIVMRRPGQHPHKRERRPMRVFALATPRLRPMRYPPRPARLEEHLLALLCVAADLKGDGRTVLTCSSEAQAERVMAEAKRLLGQPADWTRS